VHRRDDETKERFKVVEGLLEAAGAPQSAQASEASAPESRAKKPLAFCKGLEFLLDRVNAMQIDAANARLRLIAPVLQDHGIDYERGKFQVSLIGVLVVVVI
jgi:hypothetical protein